MRRSLVFVVAVLVLLTSVVMAEESSWDIAADVTLQSRLFTDNASWMNQDSQRGQFALQGQAEFRWRNADDDQRIALVPFARWDHADSERNLLDLREAYWAWRDDRYELLVGANTVFWGVTESVHLVDIVNQTDLAADVDGEQKLGQPMVSLSAQQDWGLLSVYVMPYFRERTFAGSAGRLRTPLPVDTDRPVFESSSAEQHIDLALRYSHYFGDVDIGLSLFSGTSREPRLIPTDDFAQLLPFYDQIDQVGLDLQYTRDAWLWKLEAFVRDGYEDRFAALVGGFEYTIFQLRETDADLGLLLEYQYDGRDSSEPVSVADNDLFFGARLAMNDTQDTAVLAGIVHDLDTGELLFNLEAERRLGDSYVLEVVARLFANASPGDTAYAFASDDYLQVQLTKYF